MIEVRKVVHSILYDIGEMYNRKHSDEELINTINEILHYLNVALINAESNHIVKSKALSPKNGEAKLPDDFAQFREWDEDYDGNYRFMKHSVHLDKEATLYYYYILDDVESIEDEIDLPYVFFTLIVRFVAGLVAGTLPQDALATLMKQEIDKINQNSSSRPIERRMEFTIM